MKKIQIKIAILISLMLGFSSINSFAAAEKYLIDNKNAHASILFFIKHLNYSYLTGRFDNFSGDFSYDPSDLKSSQVNVTVETFSINTNFADRDAHLRSADFLNVARYPLASFVSKSVLVKDKDSFDLLGDLTLNGITKPFTITAKKVGEGQDPWGGYRAGFEGKAEFKLADFNINFDLGPGAETLSLIINIEGIRQGTKK